MSGFQGMDPEQARGHAELLRTGSRRIDEILGEIPETDPDQTRSPAQRLA